MKDGIVYFIVGVLYLSTVYVLVRPNSNGPALVNNVLGTFADLVRGVSGETFDSSTNSWKAAS
jgi:hypothetical protein